MLPDCVCCAERPEHAGNEHNNGASRFSGGHRRTCLIPEKISSIGGGVYEVRSEVCGRQRACCGVRRRYYLSSITHVSRAAERELLGLHQSSQSVRHSMKRLLPTKNERRQQQAVRNGRQQLREQHTVTRGEVCWPGKIRAQGAMVVIGIARALLKEVCEGWRPSQASARDHAFFGRFLRRGVRSAQRTAFALHVLVPYGAERRLAASGTVCVVCVSTYTDGACPPPPPPPLHRVSAGKYPSCLETKRYVPEVLSGRRFQHMIDIDDGHRIRPASVRGYTLYLRLCQLCVARASSPGQPVAPRTGTGTLSAREFLSTVHWLPLEPLQPHGSGLRFAASGLRMLVAHAHAHAHAHPLIRGCLGDLSHT
ncbi:uncharacterized protein MYCFIDRAFT_169565 [Pseudocercospora fijiensis CIRAD86]|uniref:Uncharacterized protein n=1 Tax=Pseudocercospora fijiensis (strain CIRAD86) TaxID=383855 RepID=N1QA83_PSEFD|nr:uncharacterized protein MYCFIDRAFT_169565 [Pseudocercospora fijiensis CIRAD86]EME87818.1 hypothetical protein MYCFIDRAFT_169565 [Pseudocercospora fijiensis CIRAD86]